jgi:hypothetical protein
MEFEKLRKITRWGKCPAMKSVVVEPATIMLPTGCTRVVGFSTSHDKQQNLVVTEFMKNPVTGDTLPAEKSGQVWCTLYEGEDDSNKLVFKHLHT